MDIQLDPTIHLWFDGEHYSYAIDFNEDSDDPADDLIEGYKPMLEEAIAAITTAIERHLRQQVESC